MTRRKGEVTERQILRQWPFHVALPPEAIRGLANSDAIYGFLKPLSAGPRPCHVQRGEEELIVFCFREEKDAEAFAERFKGVRI